MGRRFFAKNRASMSKAFTKEPDDGIDDDERDDPPPPPPGGKNYITPGGYDRLQAELRSLTRVERPKIVEVVSWAAGNGDRSENGDYIYGRKRLREIDRELSHLSRRMKAARVLDPGAQEDRSRAFFGATVEIADENDTAMSI